MEQGQLQGGLRLEVLLICADELVEQVAIGVGDDDVAAAQPVSASVCAERAFPSGVRGPVDDGAFAALVASFAGEGSTRFRSDTMTRSFQITR
jgi:hypothetical protein